MLRGVRHNAKCFLGFRSFQTFEESTGRCGSSGGRLASPRDRAENEALAAYTRQFFAPGNWPAWIGATDERSEGAFQYRDGQLAGLWDPCIVTTGWSANGGRRENCVALSTDDGRWWDRDCQRRMYYICEYDY
ncbi:LOW QUALITY PROTEIN: C-type lectin domain family 11 member A [Mobula birostris]|uniref:LOW QUALITY PROTEIN: C-type lectin domain family 11 member A n=1 Tax=Mobula birostris TaxID=1983395 RepID=UPI003B288723